MNEADTRANLIEPKLKAAGWTDQQVTREFFYQRDHQYAPGRIVLAGDQVKRAKARKVDYLLRLTSGFPIAILEAKAATEPPEAGLEQAKAYARDLGLAFAFASNGHIIIEYEFLSHTSRTLVQFPGPSELWDRWSRQTFGGASMAAEAEPSSGSTRPVWYDDPLRHPYCEADRCGKTLFYFQALIVHKAVTVHSGTPSF